MDMPVTITEKALEEIRKIRETKKIPDNYGLRIGIKGGGCAGISYLLGFDKAADDDGTYDLEGLPVHISKKHTMHVIGLTLDYYQGSDEQGFLFSKPENDD
jgi:iron-sulfur cluster assembly protein